MLDLKLVRERPEVLREALSRRGALETYKQPLAELILWESERRKTLPELERLQAERNAHSREVARRKHAGQELAELVILGRDLNEAIRELEGLRVRAEREISHLILELPNVTRAEVPAGGEAHNTVVRAWGDPREDSGVQPHWDVGARLGLFDLERAAKISGSGFAVYRGRGARLVRALMNFFVDTHVAEHGYEEVWAPALVTRATMTGTGQLPKFEDDAYAITGDDGLFLIPTAEVPVTNLYRDEVLDAAALPRGFVAYTPCFRREAGSAGKDTRGIQRLHQFDKVELVRYSTPEDSGAQLELLTGHAEALLQALGLPYRVVLLAAGDTGFASAKTYDLEVFAPGVGKWLEVSSCSVCDDFQARRANIRYRPGAGEKPRFVHTLNGSALAFPRVIAALLEHHQQADGSVLLPEPLRLAMGADALA